LNNPSRPLQRNLLTATHWGAYHPRVEGGKLVDMVGVGFDPDPSPISKGWIDAYDHPARIKRPAVRKSFYENGLDSDRTLRGHDSFVEVSWEEAERLVADALTSVKSNYGNEAIFAGSYGWASAGKFHHAPSQLHRFLNCFGGYAYSVNTYSFAAAEVLLPHVMGNYFIMMVNATSWPSIIENTDLFVTFGGLPYKNTQVEFGGHAKHVQKGYMEQAAKAGVKFVSVSPLRDDSYDKLNAEWLPVVPGTDVALMLGVAHTLVESELHNVDFLNRYCVGFDRFADYLMGRLDGQPKTAEWAEDIAGIAANSIRTLAEKMSQGRTMISISWSLSRQDHGEQAYWMSVVLAAMLGQIGLPGGGIGFGYCSTNGVGNQVGRLRFQSLPVGKNPVNSFIPVSRISDMLLQPGTEFNYNGGTYTYPSVEMIYWAGGNPYHHHQNINRLIKGWKKPKCIVVHDSFWTSAARHSDIVLPAATTLERTDVSSSPRDSYAVFMDQVLPRYGESRTDFEIFSAIARQLGFEKDFTEQRSEIEWVRFLYDETRNNPHSGGAQLPQFDQFVEKGWFQVDDPAQPNILLKAFRDDPQANPLKTPSGKIEIFSETIDSFGYEDCPGHPTWMEPSEWLGSRACGSEHLHLISNQPVHKLHSQLDQGQYSRARKKDGREVIRIHPEDALARMIRTEDVVRVANDRGAFLASAKLDQNVRKGVVQIATGAWFDPLEIDEQTHTCKHGNPNTVTHDRGTSSLAQGPAAMTCIVKIEKFSGTPPKVSAFDPPKLF